MSFCSFIATNVAMPEIQLKERYITVKEAIDLQIKPHELVPWEAMDPNAQIIFIENAEDLNELVITSDAYYNVREYTSYPFIYEVNFGYSEQRAKQLLAYLQANIRAGQIVELWRVWIGDDKPVPHVQCSLEQLTVQHLVQMYDWNDENYQEQCCIVLERK